MFHSSVKQLDFKLFLFHFQSISYSLSHVYFRAKPRPNPPRRLTYELAIHTHRKRRGGNKNGGRNEASAKMGGQAPLTMCELCGIGFVHINSLDVHMKTEHFWGKFKCQRCEFKAGFASELIAHMGRNFADPSVVN